jgi:hypothetical protein
MTSFTQNLFISHGLIDSQLADFSWQQTEQGYATLSALLALQALPKSMLNPERSFVPQAQLSLNVAMNASHERTIMEGHKDVVISAPSAPMASR